MDTVVNKCRTSGKKKKNDWNCCLWLKTRVQLCHSFDYFLFLVFLCFLFFKWESAPHFTVANLKKLGRRVNKQHIISWLDFYDSPHFTPLFCKGKEEGQGKCCWRNGNFIFALPLVSDKLPLENATKRRIRWIFRSTDVDFWRQFFTYKWLIPLDSEKALNLLFWAAWVYCNFFCPTFFIVGTTLTTQQYVLAWKQWQEKATTELHQKIPSSPLSHCALPSKKSKLPEFPN